MKTEILPAFSGENELNTNAINRAATLLRAGEVVAVPTETVYGLAANAFDETAVRKIFAAKGRPQDNPLIVHIADFLEIFDLVSAVPEAAKKLADAFWSGPLTVILPKSDKIPDAVSAGLPTVAVRMPSHPVAQAVIRESGVPLAAPSANRSGSPSPTNAKYVFDDMDGRIPLILDGGGSQVGVESTVITLATEVPRVLRPGGALALSWNTFVLPKEEMRRLLSSAGLAVQTGGPYDRFEHRVDQAIKRDIVVAVK